MLALLLVDDKRFELSTSAMRTNQKLRFVLIFSHFRRFCLECKWPCGPFFPLYPCVPEASVVCVVVTGKQAERRPSSVRLF